MKFKCKSNSLPNYVIVIITMNKKIPSQSETKFSHFFINFKSIKHHYLRGFYMQAFSIENFQHLVWTLSCLTENSLFIRMCVLL